MYTNTSDNIKDGNMEKLFGLAECKAAKDEDRVIEFVATHEIEDYDRDIVKVDGVDISKIKQNKSFLWSHQNAEHPVGKIISIKKDGKKIIGKAQMTSEEENPFGYQTYKLIKGGYINNVSMSFIPDFSSIEYKEKDGRSVRIIGKSTMLEVSAVNIGANRNALITSKSLKDSFNKAMVDGVIDDAELTDLNIRVDEMTAEAEAKIKEIEESNTIADLKAKVAQLELQVKEQDLDEELEDSIYTQLYDEFVPSSDPKDQPIDEPNEPLTIDDLEEIL